MDFLHGSALHQSTFSSFLRPVPLLVLLCATLRIGELAAYSLENFLCERSGTSSTETREILASSANVYEDDWVMNKEPGIQSDSFVTIKCERGTDVHDLTRPKFMQTGSWWVTFHAVNGGLQFASQEDVYLNLAPEEGYLPEITIGSQAGTADYTEIIRDKKLYLMSKNGQVYASLLLKTIDPYVRKDFCWINAEVKYTTDGTRNLAIKQRLKR